MNRISSFGAAALMICGTASAQGMPKGDWLANLRAGAGGFLCAPASPLMRVYREAPATCPTTVEALFDKCTTSVPEVRIPSTINSAAEANRLGQVVAECISAHYMGGDVLDAFRRLQAGRAGGG